jgi:hypothetical protein
MSRTIKAIERHMISPVRSKTRLATPSVPRGELGLQPSAPGLVAEWQQRGPETISGYALRKLRLAFAPTHSVIATGAAGLGGTMRGAIEKNRVETSKMELMNFSKEGIRIPSFVIRQNPTDAQWQQMRSTLPCGQPCILKM